MKRYIVGYNFYNSQQFVNTILEKFNYIDTIYTALPKYQSGRNILLPEYESQFLNHLKLFSQKNLNINILFNAGCYGEKPLLIDFYDNIKNEIINLLNKNININSITTTYILLAKYLKQTFPNIKIIASINMFWNTLEEFEYVKKYFDSYYLPRAYNRNLQKINEFLNWSKNNNKQLLLLANTGCLKFSPYCKEHINLQSHREMAQLKDTYNTQFQKMKNLCGNSFINYPQNFLKNTVFIPPEYISKYFSLFNKIKLATRISKNFKEIINAYCNQKYQDNILNILQPTYTSIYKNKILINNIDKNWFNTVLNCNKQCLSCNYCKNIFQKLYY